MEFVVYHAWVNIHQHMESEGGLTACILMCKRSFSLFLVIAVESFLMNQGINVLQI